MKFILLSPKNRTTYNFRGDLLKCIIEKGYEVIATGPNYDEINKINDLGVRFVHIPLNKTGLNIIADLKYVISLIKLFKKEKPDITLGYTIKPVIYGAISAKMAGVKKIYSMVTGAGYVFTAPTFKAKLLRILAGLLYKIAFMCADSVIFQNTDDMNDFTDKKLLNRKKCRLINGSGVNMEIFTPAPYPQTLTFFMLSRIMYNKGVLEYLESAKIVKGRYPSVKFMLLGAVENIQDSMPSEILQPYIDNNIIEYYGETLDIISYYRQCSVYVLPSYREGIPRTVLEAMSMARPIITTNAPGCRETVKNGINGLLIDVKSIKQLSDKMEWFIKNSDKIPEMGRASLEICSEKFDVRKINQKMMEYMGIA